MNFQRIAKIVIIALSAAVCLFVLFLIFIYILGATDPRNNIPGPKEVDRNFEIQSMPGNDEQVLIDGEVVSYRDYTNTDPGYINVRNASPYRGPSFTITGEAQSRWFFQGSTNGYIYDTNDELIWEGEILTDGRAAYELIVPFEANVEIPSYAGEATLVIIVGSEADEPPEDTYEYSFEIVQIN